MAAGRDPQLERAVDEALRLLKASRSDDVDGIFGGSARAQVRDLQWKAFTPVLMIISGWSKQTNLMKQPWIIGDPYTGWNRRYLKLKMRLTPYSDLPGNAPRPG